MAVFISPEGYIIFILTKILNTARTPTQIEFFLVKISVSFVKLLLA